MGTCLGNKIRREGSGVRRFTGSCLNLYAKKSTHPCMLRESAISEKVKIDKLIKGKYNYSELTRFTSATHVDI